MYLKLIACEIAVREFSWALARSSNEIIPEYLPQGYHNDVDAGRAYIQERIDAADDGNFDAILLGYALCNNMLAGVQARSKPLIVARAHDCITWFLGSKERYIEEFTEHPGSYYYTAGWLSTRQPMLQGDAMSSGGGVGIGGSTWDQLVEKYGEDNAQYLWELEGSWTKHYTHGAYISFDFIGDLGLKKRVHEICDRHEWEYAEREGDASLLQRWLDGPWDTDDFLTVRPGEGIGASFGSDVMTIQRPRKAATGT